MSEKPHSVRITAMTYGPHGIARLDGKAVFVRGAAPGEEVEIEIREQHPSFDYADVTQVLKASPQRRQPPCIYLPRCGGCSWQHLEYAAQLEAKEANLSDALRRIGGVFEPKPRPITAAPEEFGYRGRLTLRVADRQVGFYAAASHDLVPIEHCLLARPIVAAAMAMADDLVKLLNSDVRRIEIAERGFAPGVVLNGEIEGRLADGDGAAIERWLRDTSTVAGVALHGKRWRQVWGDDRIAIAPEADLQLIARAGSFSQVNPEANRLLVQVVLALAEFQPEEAVLDVYAGAGNLSLPAARRARRVVAVEQDAVAAADARDNAVTAGLTNVEVVAASARGALRARTQARAYFDTIVLDPPRSGAAELSEDLLQLSPRKLVYVSCNPATLARDLASLAAKYRIDAIQPIDLFPQTYHLETVVRLTRR